MAADTRIDKTAAERRLVVVVDDSAGIRDVCEDVLGQAGYEVLVFAHGEAALMALATLTPTVLVVDWRMPGLDGLEVARRVRARDPHLPMLMVTGDAKVVTPAALRAGIARVLGKPFTVEELVGAVAALAAPR